ncbi:exported hypothetical protein [Candidatus Sulfotelmatobacter sp. SbA7]|nr:exported hypothetical protein [Candidatus Sulfotelmatobacter sp. SbA7]
MVLVFVDLAALLVLLAVQLVLLLLGQMPAMGGHVSRFLILDALLVLFQTRGLSGGHIAILDAIGNAVLLVGLTLVDLVHPRVAGIILSRTRTALGVRRVLGNCGAHRHQTSDCEK